MTVVMRNRVTGEYKVLANDSNSEEYQRLKVELHSDGRPRWEETGQHNLQAFKRRLEQNALTPQDLGDERQPVEEIRGYPPDVAIIPSGQVDLGHPAPVEFEQETGRAVDQGDVTVMGTASDQGVVRPGTAEGTPLPTGGQGQLHDGGEEAIDWEEEVGPEDVVEDDDQRASTAPDAGDSGSPPSETPQDPTAPAQPPPQEAPPQEAPEGGTPQSGRRGRRAANEGGQ